MELHSVDFGLDYLSIQGRVLNIHERTRLRAGLVKLQQTELLENVYFWGKFYCAKGGYFIAYSLKEGKYEFPVKKFYWADEKFDFAELPSITQQESDHVGKFYSELNLPLSGNPTRLLGKAATDEEEEEQPPAPVEDEDEIGTSPPPPSPMKLREIHRVAYLIRKIDFNTAAIPRGSYRVDENNKISPSESFKGLSLEAASSLENWAHLRPAENIAKIRALSHDDVQFSVDFLDLLKNDLPISCWALRTDNSGGIVTVRSLRFPGYCAFHVLHTKHFGSVYLGTGMELTELPFLL